MKYRTTGAWGAGEGRNLTAAEVDGNFYETVVSLAAALASANANGISNITQSGSQFTVLLQDGTSLGPFDLPVAELRDRGEWVAATAYYTNDIVSVPGSGIYRVLQDHTSDGAFDEDATNSGGDIYSKLIALPNPAETVTVPETSLVPTSDHWNAYLRCTAAAGCLVYLNYDDAPVNTEIHFRQCGAGAVILTTTDTGGLLNVPAGYNAETDTQGAVITAKYIGGGEWDVFGMLAAAT